MFQAMTHDEKALIIATVMQQNALGTELRTACKSQGITLQTYLDWRRDAQRHNEFSARHEIQHNGHPERQKERQPKPETALALALKAAQIKSYPSDPEPEPDEPEPAPEAAAPADLPAAEPVTETPPPLNEETRDMPKAAPQTVTKRRGIAAALYAALPWLNAISAKCEKAHGPCPVKRENPSGYARWVKQRAHLMTEAQRTELAAFYKRPLEVAKATRAAAKAGKVNGVGKVEKVEAEAVPKVTRKTPAGVIPDTIQPLVAQHAATSLAIANHEETGLQIRVHPPRDVNNLLNENARLKQALTALTIENLQLRGIL